MMSCLPSFHERPSFPAGLRVLLLDGTPLRQAVEAQLSALNYSVTCCDVLKDALAAITTASEAPFDIFLCEVEAFTDRTIESEQLRDSAKDLPTIVMTDTARSDEIMQSIKLGAVDVLERPLCPLKMKNLWQHHVRRMIRTVSEPALRRRSSGTLERGDHSVSRHGSSSTTQVHAGATAAATVAAATYETESASNGTAETTKQQPFAPHAEFVTTMPQSNRRLSRDDEGDDSRRVQKRKSKDFQRADTAPVPLTATPPTATTINARDATSPSVATGFDAPTVATPAPGHGMLAPTPASSPCVVASGLATGIAWGVPMNPMAVAPGITPPIFPTPSTAPINSLNGGGQWPPMLPQAAGIPGMPGMMATVPGTPTGMFSSLMPGMSMMSPAGGFGLPATGYPGQLPPLPMSMLLGACAPPNSSCGGAMGMCHMGGGGGGACTMMDAMGFAQLSPCSSAPANPSLSDRSAQDMFNLCFDECSPGAPSCGKGQHNYKIPRCESNTVLPSLEDLIAGSGADDMELELEALSLDQLTSPVPALHAVGGMKRIDSLDGLLSQSVVAF